MGVETVFETDEELLVELTDMPHWKALQRYAQNHHLYALENRLRKRAEGLMDLVSKEATTQSLADFERFFRDIEGVTRRIKRAQEN